MPYHMREDRRVVEEDSKCCIQTRQSVLGGKNDRRAFETIRTRQVNTEAVDGYHHVRSAQNIRITCPDLRWTATNSALPREERQRRQHQGPQGQLVRTESAPPPYSESSALVQTKPTKLVRAQTEIGKITPWSEQPSDDDELDSKKNKWQSREGSRQERKDSDEGDLYSTIAATRSFFGLAYGVED
jgi:hypothetical protein